jgi:ABC-type uncharacterized transport system permease subunit
MGSLLFGVLIALAVGGLMGLLHAVFSIRYKMDQIISGTVLIILAAGVSAYLFDRSAVAEGKFSRSRHPWSGADSSRGRGAVQEPAAHLRSADPGRGRTLRRSSIRAGGCARAPAASIRAPPTRWASTSTATATSTPCWAGSLAGLAGGFLVLEAVGQFQEGMTAGRGFIALAAMIFGNWMPFGAAGAAVLFGYTQALQNELLLAGVTTVPRQFVSMIPYVVTIIAVSGFVGRVRAPAAEGKVYETEGGSE